MITLTNKYEHSKRLMGYEILGIIPARSGSKGLKNKNIQPLQGKPLIAHTIEAGKKSKINRLIVSTDSPKYASISESWGAEVPFLRKKELASDNVHSVFTVIDCLKQLEKLEGYIPDIVIMLLPTSPLRLASTIDNAIDYFVDKNATSLVSIVRSTKQLLHLREIDKNGFLAPILKSNSYNVQRQDLQPIFELNGSIYISRPDVLLENKSFHLKNTIPFEMNQRESLDINSISDLDYASYLLSTKK